MMGSEFKNFRPLHPGLEITGFPDVQDTQKMVNPILGPILETQELSGRQTTLKLGFLIGNPDIGGEIQILR